MPPSLQAMKAEVAEQCYELLLILAATEKAEQGMHRLDQANSLHPTPTRAYHLGRAACQAAIGNRSAGEEERHLAASLRPNGALDHFLLGQESYKRDPTTGLPHFDAALQDRPDHFWAQCLSALCLLHPQIARPEEAIARLNACLQRGAITPGSTCCEASPPASMPRLSSSSPSSRRCVKEAAGNSRASSSHTPRGITTVPCSA